MLQELKKEILLELESKGKYDKPEMKENYII